MGVTPGHKDGDGVDPRDHWTRDILKLMALVICIAAGIIALGTILGLYPFDGTQMIYILLVVILPTWLAARRRASAWMRYVPATVVFALGVYSAYQQGFITFGVLFFALEVVLVGMLLGDQARRGAVLACTCAYSVAGLLHGGILLAQAIAAVITVFFCLVGIAALDWYYNTRLNATLAALVEGNRALEVEATTRRAQEFQFQRLAQNITDMMVEMDPRGTILFASPSHRQVMGYEPEALLGTNAFDLICPEDRDRVTTAARAAAARNTVSRVEIRARCADGSFIPLEVIGTPILDPDDGRTNGFVLVSRDIGERIRADEALRQSEQKFYTAFMTSPDSVNLHRLADGVYLDVNESFTRLTGYTRAEVLGHSTRELNMWVKEEDRTRLVKIMEEKGETENLQAGFRRKDGSIGTGLMSARVIEINGDRCILSITRDITDRIQAETALREAHTQLEQAYEATLEGWARALELRERETAEHSRRVVELTLQMALSLGINGRELIHVLRGALLHDIGKLGVPDPILLKPGPLTGEEWAVMRRHPQFAFDLMNTIPYLRPSLPIPYCHHERWDGSGYPRGLKGDEIPLVARIFAVVDVYDALLSDRPYRPAWSQADVVRYLREQSGVQFDPGIVEAFLRMVGE